MFRKIKDLSLCENGFYHFNYFGKSDGGNFTEN